VDKIERTLQGELHDTIARLRELGGAVTVEPREVPWGAGPSAVASSGEPIASPRRSTVSDTVRMESSRSVVIGSHRHDSGSCQKSRRAWPARGWKRGEPAAQEQNPAGRR